MDNPFLDRTFSIRWSQLTPAQVVPAIEFSLRDAEAALAQITGLDPADTRFGNTFLALEDSCDLLNETWAKVTHLMSVADAPALREAHNAMLPKVSAFQAGIPLNAALWERLKAAAAHPASAGLAGEQRRLLTETVAEFQQQGADLPADKKNRLEALQGELAELTQKYSENVLDATNAWEIILKDESRLRGLSPHARESARRNALQKGHGTEAAPAWRFTLHAPSMEPVMLYAEDETLRRAAWTAASAIGGKAPHDNGGLVGRILALRQEKAELLGRSHFADLVLERRMAKTGAQALAFVEDLHRRIAPAFAQESRELEEFKAAQTGGATPAHLAPWEIAFWAERLRRSRHDFDEEQLRPYFPMDRVLAGLFEITRRIFGIKVAEQPAGAGETWHAEVKFYTVHDEAGRHLGSFYADWYPRESKRGGAWMNYLITGGPRDGGRLPHLGLMCGNMTPPLDNQPALLTHREVETVFHEFGHLLHHLLGEVGIKSLNGVNVAWDFVELPSQIMDNWCRERESLDLSARHHATGERIPEELFRPMVAARNFRSATATMRQMAFARLDLELHLGRVAGEISPRLRQLLRDYLIPTEPPSPTPENRFTHIFADPVGYAAGYYSYKWAEVLDADAFTRFKSEGIFSRAVGAEFVAKVLSRGNVADPMQLFVDFMGRPPDQSALLHRAGLA